MSDDRPPLHARVGVTKADAHWIKTLIRRARDSGVSPAPRSVDPVRLYGKFNMAWGGGDDAERLAEFDVERVFPDESADPG